MNTVIRNVLLGGLVWLAVPLAAQVPQELIDKAKASGMPYGIGCCGYRSYGYGSGR